MVMENRTAIDNELGSPGFYEIFYNNMFKHNHTPMLIIHLETSKIVDCNESACLFYGHSREQLLQFKITDINTLTEIEVVREMQLAKTEHRDYFIFKHRLSDESICDVEVLSTPIVLDDKTLLISSITDLSNRHIISERLKAINVNLEKTIADSTYQLEEANARLEEMNAELEESNAELEESNALLEEEIHEKTEFARSLQYEYILRSALLENLQDGVVVCDAEGTLVLFNKKLREWHGMDAMKIPMEEWAKYYSLYHKDEITPMRTEEIPLVRALKGEAFYGGEMVVAAKDQPIRHFGIYGTPFYDASGKKLGAVGVMQDITARLKAEEQLRQSEEKYRVLYETAGIGIGFYKLDGTILSYNVLAARHMGGTPLDFEGKSIYDIFPRQAADFYMDRIRQAAASENRLVFEDEVPLPTGVLWFLSTFNKILDKDKRIIGVQIISQDITELKISERKLQLAKDAAEAASVAKSVFLANMSHEIRTPLNGLMGMLQLLQMTDLTDEQMGYIKTSKSSSDSLLKVINDILDYSKIESGNLKIEKQPFHFKEFLHDVKMLFLPSTQKKGLVLENHIQNGIPEHLIGDPFRLRQILSNMIGNAIKFTEKGRIDITVRLVENLFNRELKLEFQVKDTGIGIPKEKTSEVFQSFHQADSSTTRKYGGTGLGLSICKGLVEKMNGEMWLESIEGEGSSFFFTCVLDQFAEEIVAENNSIQSGDEEMKEDRYKLLLVEDDEVSRMVIERFAKHKGWQTVVAKNGKEAVDAYQESSFDAIAMDVQMPILDGYQATAVIREYEREKGTFTPIIAMTAHALKGDKERCLEVGMNDYLSKPIDAIEFFAVLEKWLKKDNNG